VHTSSRTARRPPDRHQHQGEHHVHLIADQLLLIDIAVHPKPTPNVRVRDLFHELHGVAGRHSRWHDHDRSRRGCRGLSTKRRRPARSSPACRLESCWRPVANGSQYVPGAGGTGGRPDARNSTASKRSASPKPTVLPNAPVYIIIVAAGATRFVVWMAEIQSGDTAEKLL
jgi:hypothetical protein